jgi:hypothetical protein
MNGGSVLPPADSRLFGVSQVEEKEGGRIPPAQELQLVQPVVCAGLALPGPQEKPKIRGARDAVNEKKRGDNFAGK